MSLYLNEPTPNHHQDFRDEAKGIVTYAQQMPLIVESGRRPAGPEDVSLMRIHSKNSNWFSFFSTGMGIVVPPGDYESVMFKIRRNSKSLKEINPETILTPMGLISHSSYDDVPGVEFTAGENGVIIGRNMTRDEALNNSALLEILGGDESFRDAVVDKMFFEGGKHYSFDKMMGLYIPKGLSNGAQEGALCVGGLVFRSRVRGNLRLDNDDAQLVGIAPEVPNWLERFRAGRVA